MAREEASPVTHRATMVVGHTWDGTPIGDAERVHWRLTATPRDLALEVDAPLHGDPAPPGPAGSTPGLWLHEVAELFVAGRSGDAPGGVPYTEIELGPHGHYLVLRFCGVRREVASSLEIDYRSTRRAGRWCGRARVPWSYLPAPPWTANAYAIAGPATRRRYLAAVPVPGPRPDFHQPRAFVPLSLARPDQST